MKVVGGRVKSIQEDACNIANNPRVPLAPIDDWLKGRNPILLAFLTSISESASSVALVHAINAIYFIAYARAIMPFLFAVNLVIYFLVRSKQVAQILSHHEPYGSYDNIRTWLGRTSQTRLPAPTGDTVIAFDNEQVLCNTWRIHVANTMKMQCDNHCAVFYCRSTQSVAETSGFIPLQLAAIH